MGVTSWEASALRRSGRTALGSLRARVGELASVRVLRVLEVSRVNEAFLAVDPRYEHGFVEERVLRRFAREEVYDLSDAFLDEALARGDRCYGLVCGGRLASFGWYGRRPTPIAPGLDIGFDPRHVYMYKGFTHPDFRGRRLHAIGMTRALAEALSEGASGMVTHVDSKNTSSLASCYRMGYADVGRIYLARVLGRSFAHADSGCHARGIGVSRGA